MNINIFQAGNAKLKSKGVAESRRIYSESNVFLKASIEGGYEYENKLLGQTLKSIVHNQSSLLSKTL